MPPLPDGYAVHLLGEGAVTVDDVLAFWEREGAVSGEEADRRVHEVLFVATDASGTLAGVSTAYLERDEQLRMDLWYFRAFVGSDHRRSQIGRHLLHTTGELLQRRFVTGEDVRGAGLVTVAENAELAHARTEAVTPRRKAVFVGRNRDGARVRVRYFPGAVAPPPP
jgi:hypothetical protein